LDLIVITPESTSADEIEIVNRMLANGLQRLHVRKPSYGTEDYKDYIKTIDRRFYPQVVIHGSFELYSEYGLGGIHLNSAARNDTLVREQVKNIPSSAISTSFHSWEEIRKNSFDYNYVFISPVFDSISKPGYKGCIDLDGADETKQIFAAQHKYCPKITGLGGVGPEQLKTLHEAGFDGGAMLGSIWNSADPYAVFLEAMTQLKSL